MKTCSHHLKNAAEPQRHVRQSKLAMNKAWKELQNTTFLLPFCVTMVYGPGCRVIIKLCLKEQKLPFSRTLKTNVLCCTVTICASL